MKGIAIVVKINFDYQPRKTSAKPQLRGPMLIPAGVLTQWETPVIHKQAPKPLHQPLEPGHGPPQPERFGSPTCLRGLLPVSLKTAVRLICSESRP